MRRADRLFRIVQHLRGRRLTTAAFLAERLGVSLRTVYRDVRDLSLSGLPIEGEAGEREVWPLALYFWGGAWTIGAWCEGRDDFRNFRVDRIAALEALERRYPDQPGRRLSDFLRAMQAN